MSVFVTFGVAKEFIIHKSNLSYEDSAAEALQNVISQLNADNLYVLSESKNTWHLKLRKDVSLKIFAQKYFELEGAGKVGNVRCPLTIESAPGHYTQVVAIVPVNLARCRSNSIFDLAN